VGGGVRWFISKNKKQFKELNVIGGDDAELLKYVNTLSNGELISLYDDLNEYTDRHDLIRCLAKKYMDTNIPAEFPQAMRNNISERKIAEAADAPAAAQRKFGSTTEASEESPGQGFGLGGKQEAAQFTKLVGDTQHAPSSTQYEQYNGFGRKKRIPAPPIPGMDAYADAVTTTSHGGSKRRPKSSRRHRRVRTLHKRRKSSKVRKMRYRRTHSRSRR